MCELSAGIPELGTCAAQHGITEAQSADGVCSAAVATLAPVRHTACTGQASKTPRRKAGRRGSRRSAAKASRVEVHAAEAGRVGARSGTRSKCCATSGEASAEALGETGWRAQGATIGTWVSARVKPARRRQ